MRKEISWSAVAIVFLGFAWHLGLGATVRHYSGTQERKELAAQWTDENIESGIATTFSTAGAFDTVFVVSDGDIGCNGDTADEDFVLDNFSIGAEPKFLAQLRGLGFERVEVCGRSRRISQ